MKTQANRKGQPFNQVAQFRNDDGELTATLRAHKVNGRLAVAADNHKDRAWFIYTDTLKVTLDYFKRLKATVARTGVPENPIKVLA